MLMRKHSLVSLSLALVFVLAAATPSFPPDLPPVPDASKKQGVLRVGVKCDYPPDGYLDAQGKPQGVEVSLALHVAATALKDAPDDLKKVRHYFNHVVKDRGGVHWQAYYEARKML